MGADVLNPTVFRINMERNKAAVGRRPRRIRPGHVERHRLYYEFVVRSHRSIKDRFHIPGNVFIRIHVISLASCFFQVISPWNIVRDIFSIPILF